MTRALGHQHQAIEAGSGGSIVVHQSDLRGTSQLQGHMVTCYSHLHMDYGSLIFERAENLEASTCAVQDLCSGAFAYVS